MTLRDGMGKEVGGGFRMGIPGAPQDEAGLTRKFETSHVGVSLEGMMLKLKLQCFGHLM